MEDYYVRPNSYAPLQPSAPAISWAPPPSEANVGQPGAIVAVAPPAYDPLQRMDAVAGGPDGTGHHVVPVWLRVLRNLGLATCAWLLLRRWRRMPRTDRSRWLNALLSSRWPRFALCMIFFDWAFLVLYPA